MVKPQGRKPLSVMIGLMSPKGSKTDHAADGDEEDGEDTATDYEPDEGEMAACQDVIDAMAKRDPKELSAALHHWMELAGYGQHEEEG